MMRKSRSRYLAIVFACILFIGLTAFFVRYYIQYLDIKGKNIMVTAYLYYPDRVSLSGEKYYKKYYEWEYNGKYYSKEWSGHKFKNQTMEIYIDDQDPNNFVRTEAGFICPILIIILSITDICLLRGVFNREKFDNNISPNG